jgi:hypothetical protein
MDDNNNPIKPSAPVMDIQPPKPLTPTTPAVVVPDTDTSPSEATAIPVSIPGDTTVTEQPTSAPSDDLSPETSESAPAAPSLTNSPATDNPMAIKQTEMEHKKAGMPKAAIIVAIVVGLCLIAMATYAYMKVYRDSAVKPTPASTAVAPAPAPVKVTSKDVDATSQEVDDSIKSVDEAKDFADADLTDATLGL